MLFDIYASLLILFFFITNLAKGLLTPTWKLREPEQNRSTTATVFWLTLTIALLVLLKHLYFGRRSDSALSIGLSAILVYEFGRGFIKLVLGWDSSRFPQTVQKVPALAELGYFSLLVITLIHIPVGTGTPREQHALLVTNDGQVLDASLYQKDPDKFLESAKLLLKSQADRMNEMREQLEIQKGYFQRSGKPNATVAVAAIDRFEVKLEYVLTASAKVQDDLAASNTLSIEESANFLRALQWNNDLLQTGERTIQVLKEQTGA